jgi:hypothetical protein
MKTFWLSPGPNTEFINKARFFLESKLLLHDDFDAEEVGNEFLALFDPSSRGSGSKDSVQYHTENENVIDNLEMISVDADVNDGDDKCKWKKNDNQGQGKEGIAPDAVAIKIGL